jgi:F-type H+-transporting ATPase subunit delta
VTVTSAAPLDAQQQQALSAALQRKLKRNVRLHCETDPTLIGGAVLRAGDLVIDGSLRSRLDRIAFELTA